MRTHYIKTIFHIAYAIIFLVAPMRMNADLPSEQAPVTTVRDPKINTTDITATARPQTASSLASGSLSQQAYLITNNGWVGRFGESISISGDTVVVGAHTESSSASDSGAVYVYVRSGAVWTRQAYLKASNVGAYDHFGYSVAISGDTLVVGAYGESSSATGVNGNQFNNDAIQSGAAYVFVRNGTSWTQQAYLKASNSRGPDSTFSGGNFGISVAISGDTIVVGAPGEDSNSTGVNGNQSNTNGENSGAAYVFVRSGTTWTQQAYLKASNTGGFDGFGSYVAVSGDTAVVTAPGEDSSARGPNGDGSNNLASDSGAAYVFSRTGNIWTQQAYLKASNTGAGDGLAAVAVAGDTIVLGASFEDSSGIRVNGDQSNDLVRDSGCAYIFTRDGQTWRQEAYIKASRTDEGDRFGVSVAVSDDIVVVGAFGEDSNLRGIYEDEDVNSGFAFDSGAAYVFRRQGSEWAHHAYIKPSNTEVGDYFGVSVASSSGTFVVGAPNKSRSIGAAFVFVWQQPDNVTVNLTTATFTGITGELSSTPSVVNIIVSNTGNAISYTISADQTWIKLNKSSGIIFQNGLDNFTISAIPQNLAPGMFSGKVTVSAVGRPMRIVDITLTVTPGSARPSLQAFPPRLDFISTGGATPPPQALVIRSSDTSAITGTVSVSGPGWLVSRTPAFATPSIAEFETRSAVGTLPSNSTISLVPSNSQVPALSIPVTIHDGGPRVYSIPSVVDGGGFTTVITIVNLDTVEAVVSLEFHRVAGAGGETGLWLPQMANNAAILGATIPPGGSRTWSTTGNPSLADVGWARIRTGQRVGGFAVLKQTVAGRADQEAAVPVVSSWQQRFLLPFDNTGGLVTALALTNASDRESGEVRAYFRDETGQPISGSYQSVLPANGHVAFASPEVLPFLNGRRGTAEFVMAGGRMSAVGLRFGASAFTSFEPQSLNESSSGRLILPHITDGSAGGATFLTSITLVNRDVVPATVSLRFYRRTGVANTTAIWTPPMIGNQVVQNVTIPPGTSRVWQTAGTGMLEQGWGEILTSQRVTGFAVFLQRIPGRTDQEAAVPLNAGPFLRFLLPFDNQGFTTTMALVNFSGGATATVRAIVRDEQHRVLSDGTLTLPPGGHTAFALPAQFPATGSRRGTIEFLTQSGELSALGLRFAGEAFTSFRPQVF